MRWNLMFRWAVAVFVVAAGAGTWTARPSAQEPHNEFATQFDIRLGERIFGQRCSRCHGQDARGNDETGAPDLTTGRFNNASSPAGLFKVIREGISGTAMLPISPDTPDTTVWQIVSFLESRSTDPIGVDLPGTASAGQQVYNGKGDCGSCHILDGKGGRQGPDLSHVGERRDPSELKAALIDPNAEVTPRWWTIRVTRQDGSVIEGLRMGEDTFSVRVIDADANLWSFQKGDVRSVERTESSTMPSYGEKLTASEVDDLVAYLFSLRRES